MEIGQVAMEQIDLNRILMTDEAESQGCKAEKSPPQNRKFAGYIFLPQLRTIGTIALTPRTPCFAHVSSSSLSFLLQGGLTLSN